MRDRGLKPERVATLVTGSPTGPVVQRAETVAQVPSCPKEPSLRETINERHIPRGVSPCGNSNAPASQPASSAVRCRSGL